MKAIQEWFEAGAPFKEGVAIYLSLPNSKPNIKRTLERGKNSYNKSLLIKELRKAKNEPPAKRGKKAKKKPSSFKAITQPVTDTIIANEHLNKQQKEASAKVVFGSIKYNELPPELKVRYREAKDLFYNLCDLKVALNEVAPESTKEALAIQLQIEELDEQRIMIWKELDHWQNHKTILPTQAEDFTALTPGALVRKKANFASNITKQMKRIDDWYDALIEANDLNEINVLERKIAKGEKSVHQHKLNINKIDELLL